MSLIANPLLPSARTPRSHTETGRAHSLPTMHTMYMAQDLRSRSAPASAGGTSSMSESKGRATRRRAPTRQSCCRYTGCTGAGASFGYEAGAEAIAQREGGL